MLLNQEAILDPIHIQIFNQGMKNSITIYPFRFTHLLVKCNACHHNELAVRYFPCFNKVAQFCCKIMGIFFV